MLKSKTNQHGFTILKDSKTSIEATARINEHDKFVFLGRCTFEKKHTQRYGTQVIIVVYLPEGEYPRLEVTDYAIKRGRIEICIPEIIARKMRLIK